jgi:hypothetical protein
MMAVAVDPEWPITRLLRVMSSGTYVPLETRVLVVLYA